MHGHVGGRLSYDSTRADGRGRSRPQYSPVGRRTRRPPDLTIDSVFRKVFLPLLVVLLPVTIAPPAVASGRPSRARPAAITLVAPVPCPRRWHPTAVTNWRWQLA